MRVTNKMMTTKYTRSLNTLSSDLNKYNNQVTSGRKFSNASEDVSSAVRAYKIRGEISRVESYQANIEHANSSLTNAESSLMEMEKLVQNSTEKIIAGLNATQSADERKIIATELRLIQDQLLRAMNTKTTGGYLFGGTNTTTKPFTVDENGKLLYNGHVMDTLTDGSPQKIALLKDTMYADIGLGLEFNADSTLNQNTAFAYSIPGINIAGSGTVSIEGITGEVSNNIYSLLGEIASSLESEDFSYDTTNALYGQFTKSSASILQGITQVGAKSAYLDFLSERYETRTLNLQEDQVSIEGIDPAYSIIHYKTQEVAYNAALQMGSRILQQSLFDYMR